MLRRHMVLLMKWLHPDTAEQHRSAADVDRSVFASRIAAAWDDLKTDDRRSAYDQQIARQGYLGGSVRTAAAAIKLGPTRHADGAGEKEKSLKHASQSLGASPQTTSKKYDPLLIRIARLLWRRG